MEIDPEVLDWLSLLEVLEIRSKLQMTPRKKYILDSHMTSKFSNGLYIIQIIRKMLERRNMSMRMLNNMKFMESAATPVARLYNWNLVAEAMKLIDSRLDRDAKNLIISGDLKMLHLIIEDLYKKDKKWMLPSLAAPKIPALSRKAETNDFILEKSKRKDSGEHSKVLSKEMSLPNIRNSSVSLHTGLSKTNGSKLMSSYSSLESKTTLHFGSFLKVSALSFCLAGIQRVLFDG